ncbi:MAG: LptF/LptG family permease, partial [Candidatus Cloacimonadaceae bacterium]|nr:LptF/LptG family permease [Candidatus Cloacimonadaceae bacterium]
IRAFDHFIINIRNVGNKMDFFETGYRSDREMTHRQLREGIADKKNEISAKQSENAELAKKLELYKFSMRSPENERENRRLGILQKMNEDRILELTDSLGSLQVEYHKKYALSFAIIIFVLIGVPLGLMTRSSGIGMAFSVSSVIFLIYYVSLTGGEQLADKGHISPFIAMWISNIVFFVISILLIIASIYEKRLVDLHRLSWRISHLKVKKTEIPDEIIH